MRRIFALALTVVVSSAAYAAGAAAPESAVRDIYAADAPFITGAGPEIMGDKAAGARFLSAALLRKINADETAADKRNEPTTIEDDPFVDAQEATVDDLKISLLSNAGARASVLADFDRGGGVRERLTFSLVLEKGRWRVDDIAYALAGEPRRTLRGELNRK